MSPVSICNDEQLQDFIAVNQFTPSCQVFDTNFANGGTELKVAAPATVAPERFQKIAWGGPTSADGKDGVSN